MKKLVCNFIIGVFFTISPTLYGQNVGINATGAAPDASATLDITSTDKGLLIPRVFIPNALAPAPVATPAQSLLVYNTNDNILNGDSAGYYYWDNNQWIKLLDGNPTGDAWLTLGNAGTIPSINFIGTTDAQDLVFKTNNTENMRINTNGNVDIGATYGDARLYTRIMSTDLTTNYGIYNYHDGGITAGTTYGIRSHNNSATSGSKYGIYSRTDAEGTGTRYGMYNATYLNSSSNLNVYGFYNYVSTGGSSSSSYQRGIYNVLSSSSATGIHHGIYTSLGLAASSTSTGDCGQFTTVDYSSGTRYGEFKTMTTSSSFTGTIYGDYNEVNGLGNDNIYGVVADIQNKGNGTHYGIYSDVPGNFNDYAAMFMSGNVVMNESGGDYDVRIEGSSMTNLLTVDASTNRIGIGVTTPLFMLDIDHPSTLSPTNVYRGRNSSATGTRTQIGSVEYFQDQSSTIDFTGGSNFSINLNASASYDLQLAFNSAAKPGSNVWTIASDKRLKEDINPFRDGLSVLKAINPVYFKYNGKANIKDENYFIGVIAQDLEEVAPYMVGSFETAPGDVSFEEQESSTETYKSVDNGAMTYIAINAIKELDARQTKMSEQLTSISDFGVVQVNKDELFIPFSESFKTQLQGIPVITVTTVNSTVSVTITEQSKHGFSIKVSDLTLPLMVNWIAMAKIDPIQNQENHEYSSSERQKMLEKVKAENATINYQREHEEKVKRQFEKDNQVEEQIPLKAVPATKIENEKTPEEIESEQSEPQN